MGEYRKMRAVVLSLAAVAMSAVCPAHAAGAAATGPSAISQLVQRIKTDSDKDAQADADGLMDLLCANKAPGITEVDIDGLISLLHDPDNTKVRIAASALGNIGPKAARAIPDLEDALKKAEAAEAAHGPIKDIHSIKDIKQSDYIQLSLSSVRDGGDPTPVKSTVTDCNGEFRILRDALFVRRPLPSGRVLLYDARCGN